MNKERRQELCEVAEYLDYATDRLEEIIADEEDAYYNLNDGLQSSCTGMSMMAAVDEMQGIGSDIEGVKERLDGIINPRKAKKDMPKASHGD